MSVDVGSAVGYLDLDISGFLANLRSAQSEADAASKNIATKIGNNLTGIGKGITGVGTKLTKTITAPIVGAGVAAGKLTADFDARMSKVSAISGATGKDLDDLRAKAKEMGLVTKFSASEAADAFNYMAMAGWKTEDMLDGIEGIMNLAAASGEDLATTSDIVTDALTAFGLGAEDSGHFADILASASSNANTNVAMLGESFKYCAPLAGALGYEAEDVAVALGLMANSGIKSSQAGTSLRSALTRLAKPTKQVAEMMDKYKISLTDSKGQMKPLSTLMDELRDKLGGLSEAQQAQAVAALFGQEAMSGMMAIINASPEDYQKLTDAIGNCDGAAKNMADTMMDNLNGQITILKSSLEGLGIEIGEILMPHFKNLVSKIQELVTKFQGLSKEQKEQIVKWAAIAAAVGPVLIVAGKLVTGFGGLITTFSKVPKACTKVVKGVKGAVTSVKNVGEAFKLAKAGWTGMAGSTSKLGTALAGITGPMVIVAALVVALVAAFVNLWKNNEEFREKIISIWGEIKETFAVAVDRIKSILEQLQPVFDALKIAFEAFVEFLKIVWEGFCELVAPIFVGAFQIISDTISAVFDIIYHIVQGIIDLFSGDLEGALSNFGQVFVDIWNWVCDVFSSVGDTLLGIAETICNWFGTTWNEVWTATKDFFVGIWESVTTFLSEAWETIKAVVQVGVMLIGEILSAAWQIITLPFMFIWENCKEVILEAWEYIKTTVSDAIEKVSAVISAVWEVVSGVFETIWTPIKEFMQSIWDAISSAVSSALDAIGGVISSVFNAAKDLITKVWDGIKDKTSGTVDGIKTKVSSGFDAVKSKISGVLDGIKKKFDDIWNKCTSTVSKAVDKLKSIMHFSWSLPDLKLPHISISGSFSLRPPSVPHFSIQWYKSAMENGMIMNSATIFGFDPLTGKFLGGGEAGSETVVGTKSLMKMIRTVVGETMSGVLQSISDALLAMRDGFASSADKLAYELAQLVGATRGYTTSVESIGGADGALGGINYSLLAAMLADILRKSPVNVDVGVYMDDGDVYLDKERVGRTVAPVVSRVIVQGK